MSRTLREMHVFSRADLEIIARSTAKMEIIGSIYRGKFDKQEIEWKDDGSIIVYTVHTPAKD